MHENKTMAEESAIHLNCELDLDMDVLLQQHNLLTDIIDQAYNDGEDSIADMLCGILCVMDSIGDQAIDQGLWKYPEYDEKEFCFREERYNDILSKLKKKEKTA